MEVTIMFNNSAFTMPVVPAGYSSGGNGNGGNGFGEGSWIWILVIFALLFGWGNNGNNGGGNNGGGNAQFIPYQVGGYDASVQRGFDQQAIIGKLDGLTYGLSDSTYALSNSINNGFFGVQQTLCQGFNGVSREIADCCCKTQRAIDGVNYNMATQACDTRNAIANSTRDIIDNANCNTRSILDFLVQDKISTLTAENQSLKLKASQAEQNAFIAANQEAQTATLIRRLGADCPVPAYVVPNPNCCYNPFGFGYGGYGNSGCGCGCA